MIAVKKSIDAEFPPETDVIPSVSIDQTIVPFASSASLNDVASSDSSFAFFDFFVKHTHSPCSPQASEFH